MSLTAAAGSRQLYVEDLAGAPLTALSFGAGGTLPFRVRVADNLFNATSSGYTVSATMTNLYLKSGAGHDFTVKVPSADVAVGFGSTPLSASGVSVELTPQYLLSGTIPSCAALGLTSLATSPLCLLLGTAGVPVSNLPVSGLPTTVTLPTGNLADLPAALGGAESGAFTSADYVDGLGAGDTTGTGTGTHRTLMSGVPQITANLLSTLTSALPTGPLTTPTDAGAQVPISGVLAAMQTAGGTLSTLASDLTALGDLSTVSTVLNSLTATLKLPTVTDLSNLTGNYLSFPLLSARATAPQPGTYEGTLTVTFVQN